MAATPAKVLAQFRDEGGEQTGPPLDLPADMSAEQLNELLNELLHNEETLPYSFYVNEEELSGGDTVAARIEAGGLSTEQALTIVYVPQSVYRVRAVTRCTATLEGHTEAVLTVAFSPDGQQLVSGSGDHSVRFWDLNTQLPAATCKGHRGWVLCAAWSPDARWAATGGMDNEVRIWRSPAHLEQATVVNPAAFSAQAVARSDAVTDAAATGSMPTISTGSTREEKRRRQRVFTKPIRILKGHRKPITAVSWEPAHLQPVSKRLASASKDGTVKVWDTLLGRCLFTCSGHSMSVTCVRWGGSGLLYTGSQDRKVMVFSAKDVWSQCESCIVSE
jgi:ribosome assembly protein 4